ncbi:hypothetical protein [Aquimarina pacifica]|uniref:hypothetical protein n=1 Tax=Aquimarina pacifica TaxID=1296415 RepID=UPI00046F6CCC|nr:hypothetical protein [Aquimarina pacifica]
MKKTLLFLALIVLGFNSSFAQKEYKIITVIESIVPNGLGRSRMLSSNEARDYKEYTSTRTGEDDKRNKSDRGEIRVKGFDETKLLNFYNIGGIRFQNIVANDAIVTSKLNAMSAEGWSLDFVNSGVESVGGKDDKNGIYVTRYTFSRNKQ